MVYSCPFTRSHFKIKFLFVVQRCCRSRLLPDIRRWMGNTIDLLLLMGAIHELLIRSPASWLFAFQSPFNETVGLLFWSMDDVSISSLDTCEDLFNFIYFIAPVHRTFWVFITELKGQGEITRSKVDENKSLLHRPGLRSQPCPA